MMLNVFCGFEIVSIEVEVGKFLKVEFRSARMLLEKFPWPLSKWRITSFARLKLIELIIEKFSTN